MLLDIAAKIAPFKTAEITNGTVRQNQAISFAIVDYQQSLTMKNVRTEKKIFQMDKIIALKTTCAIIAMFNSSISITTDRMDAIAIYETAVMFLDKYTHDSIADLILCFKMVKEGHYGTIFNRIDTAVILGFIDKYMDQKSRAHETNYLIQKSEWGEFRTELGREDIEQERRNRAKEIKLTAEKTRRERKLDAVYKEVMGKRNQ